MLPQKRAGGAEVEELLTAAGGETLSKKKKGEGEVSRAAASSSSSAPVEKNEMDGGPMDCDKIGDKAVLNGGKDGGVPQEIDEDLHSRQLAVYGRETMRKLIKSNVLISGLSGLGAEIAKNLVLAGVKSVTLHDEQTVQLRDLSSNFFLSDDDVGKNRALACVQKLQELNNAVLVSTLSELSAPKLSEFQAVVFTDVSLDKAIEYDDFCHKHEPPIAFIKTEVRGLFGGVFCDFGPEFTVVDVDGEEPHSGIVVAMSNDSTALVTCVDDERLEFQDGDLVLFTEVQGMTELNDNKPNRRSKTHPSRRQ